MFRWILRSILVLCLFVTLGNVGLSCSTTPADELGAEASSTETPATPADGSDTVDNTNPTDAGGQEAVSQEAATEAPAACNPPPPVVPKSDFFTDVSGPSGIQVEGFITNFTKRVPINDHSRLGFVDINGDGFDDIVAHSLFPNPQAGIPFQHRIYLNNGDGTFKHFSEESGLKNVQAAFFAFADVDNDGDQDCFAGIDIRLSGQTNQIYLNDGKGRFTLKANSGVNDSRILAMNAVFADFNNDGKIDLYVGSGGTSMSAPEALYFGNGDGTFTNVTKNLAGNAGSVSNGSVACDFDNDGDLDIFVSVYGVSSRLGANILWLNDGKGNFTNAAREKGFESLGTGNYYLSSTRFGGMLEPNKQPGQYVGSNGFGIDCKDVNNDGLMDVFLATISHPNAGTYSRKWSDPSQLLINQGANKKFAFRNEFLLRKLKFNEGDIDSALVDFDNDGRMDISITRDNKYERNYTDVEQKAWLGLYHQQANGTFKSLGPVSGINQLNPKDSASLTTCTQDSECSNGEACLLKRCRQPCKKDSDCKSKDDLCGHYWDNTTSKKILICRTKFLMKGGQNHAWSDIDGDGDLDLLVGGRDKGGGRPNFLFRNEIGSKNRWLAFRLVGDGKAVNRDAIGARVTLVHKDGQLLREVQSSRGTYNSIDTRVLHFGLANTPCNFEIKVRWPDGKTATFSSDQIKENRYWTLTYPDQIK